MSNEDITVTSGGITLAGSFRAAASPVRLQRIDVIRAQRRNDATGKLVRGRNWSQS